LLLGWGCGLIISFIKKVLVGLLDNTIFLLFAGFLEVVGMFIVSYPNVWKYDKTVIVTIIGWIALLKGVYLLVSPRGFYIV
jgi:hypothetical protein